MYIYVYDFMIYKWNRAIFMCMISGKSYQIIMYYSRHGDGYMRKNEKIK